MAKNQNDVDLFEDHHGRAIKERSESNTAEYSAAVKNESSPNQSGGLNESPESTSLFSNEGDLPSGYNSGEQYDTVSIGYMSGEAYELPEKRIELSGPGLDPIEECLSVLNIGGSPDDENKFEGLLPMLPPLCSINKTDVVVADINCSSSDDEDGTGVHIPPPVESIVHTGKNKPRKKMTTFATPIEQTSEDNNPNWSDNGTTADLDAYSKMPSDTDTSVIDSDANLILMSSDAPDDAVDIRRGIRRKRLSLSLSKKAVCDEVWFRNNDNFRWRLFRQISFWLLFSAIILSSAFSLGFMILVKNQCTLFTAWYQGSVIIDIQGSQFGQDYIDLDQLSEKLGRYRALGIQTVLIRLPKNKNHMRTDQMLQFIRSNIRGERVSIEELANNINHLNMSLMMQLNIVEGANESINGKISLELEQATSVVIRYMAKIGVNAISLVGLECFGDDIWIAKSLEKWNQVFKKYSKKTLIQRKHILTASHAFTRNLINANNSDVTNDALIQVGLVDQSVDVSNNRFMENVMKSIGISRNPAYPWINWILVEKSTGKNSAAILAIQLFLPGTITISEHYTWAQSELLANLTKLRQNSVPIRMNGQMQVGIHEYVPNLEYNSPLSGLLQLDRFYNRRNRMILLANISNQTLSLAKVSKVYSGGKLELDTDGVLEQGSHVVFSDMYLSSGQAIVIKLDK